MIKKLIVGIINIFLYILKVLERILRLLLQSAIVCCPAILTLAIVNTIFGVNIRFSYYLIMAAILTFGSAIIRFVFKIRQMLSIPVKKSKKVVPSKTSRKTQRAIQRKRRRIS